jgi:hypothetical protein
MVWQLSINQHSIIVFSRSLHLLSSKTPNGGGMISFCALLQPTIHPTMVWTLNKPHQKHSCDWLTSDKENIYLSMKWRRRRRRFHNFYIVSVVCIRSLSSSLDTPLEQTFYSTCCCLSEVLWKSKNKIYSLLHLLSKLAFWVNQKMCVCIQNGSSYEKCTVWLWKLLIFVFKSVFLSFFQFRNHDMYLYINLNL